MSSEAKELIQAAKRLMREEPTINNGVALQLAGEALKYDETAEMLDNLLSIDERASVDSKMIDRLKSRPEFSRR